MICLAHLALHVLPEDPLHALQVGTIDNITGYLSLRRVLCHACYLFLQSTEHDRLLHYKIRARHFDRQLEEMEWRFNNRNNSHRFRETMKRILTTDAMRCRELVHGKKAA